MNKILGKTFAVSTVATSWLLSPVILGQSTSIEQPSAAPSTELPSVNLEPVAPAAPRAIEDPFATQEDAMIGSIIQNRLITSLKDWKMLAYGVSGGKIFGVIGVPSTEGKAGAKILLKLGDMEQFDLGKGVFAQATVVALSPGGVVLETEKGQKVIIR